MNALTEEEQAIVDTACEATGLESEEAILERIKGFTNTIRMVKDHDEVLADTFRDAIFEHRIILNKLRYHT